MPSISNGLQCVPFDLSITPPEPLSDDDTFHTKFNCAEIWSDGSVTFSPRMTTEVREMKLVLVGNTSVGKTCIAKMATTGSFVEDSVPTLGASYVSKLVRVDETEVRLQIWDTAGQERYRGMTPMYFRGSHVAIVAYAITDEDSFNGVDSWITSLRDNADPEIALFLVGNKCDLEDQRTISTEKGQAKATEIGATFYEVSAKTGDRVEDLFLDLAKAFLEKSKSKDQPKAPETLQLTKSKAQAKGGCC
jgi:Ras-related protein Rab-5C